MITSAKTLLVPVLLALMMFPGARAFGAVDMFLKLMDSQGAIVIEGDSLDAQHPKEIVVLSFSHGISVPISTPVGGGGSAGKPTFSDLGLSRLLDKASPLLYSYAAQGRHIATAVLSIRKSGASPIELYRITLTDVLVSSVQTSGGGDVLSESVSLNFRKIEWRYVPQKADGSPDTPVVASWDLSGLNP